MHVVAGGITDHCGDLNRQVAAGSHNRLALMAESGLELCSCFARGLSAKPGMEFTVRFRVGHASWT